MTSSIVFSGAANSPPVQAAQVLLQNIDRIGRLSAATSILDIAAGPGTIFSQIFNSNVELPPGTRLIAQDIDDSSLNQIRLRHDQKPWNRVETLNCNGQDLRSIATASQSHVVSQMGIFLMPDPSAALSEARRVLVDGGTFGMSTVASASWNTEVLGQVTALFPTRRLNATDINWRDPMHFKAFLEKHGFIDVEVSETEIWIPFADRQSIVESLWTMPYVSSLTDGLNQEEVVRAKSAMVEYIAQTYPDVPGKLPGKALIGVARK